MAASAGDTVRVHYRGTLDDGTEFDSSYGRDPLEFTLGQGVVIAGFETGVSGLDVGGKRSVHIEPAEAYGPYVDELVHLVEAEAFSEEPYLDAQVQLVAPDGSLMEGRITEIREDGVVLDFNHPLAGKPLTFEIELVEIVGA